MEGIEKLELLELIREDKKIRIYLPKYSDVLNSFLTKEDVETLIQQRQNAKENKNYVEADRIRNRLKDSGIISVDHKDKATTWDTEHYFSDETRVFRLEFKMPKKMNIKMSYPNPTYLSHQEIELHSSSKYGRSVLVDLKEIVDDFYLASNFTLYVRGDTQSLVNTWDDRIKTMVLYKNFKEVKRKW